MITVSRVQSLKVILVEFVDNGVYVEDHVSMLRLPSTGDYSIYVEIQISSTLLNTRGKSMETKQNNIRSYYKNGFDGNSSGSVLLLSRLHSTKNAPAWFLVFSCCKNRP